MTLEQLAYLAEIIGVILVIASLVYIGSELRQNTEALEAQTRFNQITVRSNLVDNLLQNEKLLDILYRASIGGDVTPSEHATARAHAMRMLEMWEWMFAEYEAGTLTMEKIPVEAWRSYFHHQALPNIVSEVWPERKKMLNANFVKFVEENVVNE